MIAPASHTGGQTVQAFYVQTYQPLRLLGKAPSTAQDYGYALGHFCRIVGDLNLDDIDDVAMAEFARGLLETQKPPTASKYLREMGAVLRFAAKKHVLAIVPEIPKLREDLASPRAFLIDEVTAILGAARQQRGSIAEVAARDWWESLILTLYDCGGRIEAVIATPTAQIDLASGWITLPAENQKQHRGQVLRLHPDTIAACERIWDAERERMWPWPYCRETLFVRFRRILKQADVFTWKGTGSLFHRLRKSCASYAAAAGLDPQVQMGHSSSAVTARYLDERIVRRTHAADVLPRPKF